MKRSYHEILSYIYDKEEVSIRDLSKIMKRKFNDHRDFYGLCALLKEGYIEFTGPIPSEHSLIQAYTFQCYAQGEGQQNYKTVSLMSNDGEGPYFFIGPKGVSYFHQRSEIRKGWYITAALAFFAAIVSGVIVGNYTTNSKTEPQKTITSGLSPASPVRDAASGAP